MIPINWNNCIFWKCTSIEIPSKLKGLHLSANSSFDILIQHDSVLFFHFELLWNFKLQKVVSTWEKTCFEVLLHKKGKIRFQRIMLTFPFLLLQVLKSSIALNNMIFSFANQIVYIKFLYNISFFSHKYTNTENC